MDSNKAMLAVIIGAFAVTLLCVFGMIALGAASGDAVESALARQDASAYSSQASTNVCVGIFLWKSCTTNQQATTTATRTSEERDPDFGESLIVLLCASPIIVALLIWSIISDHKEYDY